MIFLLLIIAIMIIYMIKNKLIIRFDTFFRKGFEKKDDKFGIYCFDGKQGDGKTYSVVDFLKETRRKEQTIITNVKSFYKNNKEICIYETDFFKIMKMCEENEYGKKYIIFYDEIFTLLEKGKLDKKILGFLSQMRKRGLILVTTAQEWLEINVTFRRYVRYRVKCKMTNLPIFNCAISRNIIEDAYQMKWDNLENEYVCPVIRTTIKKCSLKIANSYDTYETIGGT